MKYKEFIKLREEGYKGEALRRSQYYPIPVEYGLFICSDRVYPQVTPPFLGVFESALNIEDYNDLLKQRTQLDNTKIIVQKVPITSKGELLVDYDSLEVLIDGSFDAIPSRTATIGTPLELDVLNFDNSPNRNNIEGLGTKLYWDSVGVNGALLNGSQTNNQIALYSLLNDAGFVDHLYVQFQNFVDLRLMILQRKNSSTYYSRVNFFGNRYTDDKDKEKEFGFVSSANNVITKALAYSYHPQEVSPKLLEDKMIKEMLTPIVLGSQMTQEEAESSDKGTGAPEKDATDLTPDGQKTREGEANENRS